MLLITIPAVELWDERNEVFISTDAKTLQLEHSLVSLSKWESRWEKPFLSNKPKTEEETLDYVRCMTLTQNVKPDVYIRLSDQNILAINQYIDAPMTATHFSKDDGPRRNGGEQITAELIYYWMVALNIPFECQKWHLNRLFTLIRICNIKNQPPKRQSRRSIMNRNAALNASRRKRLNTKG
ncbi:MAG: hypothetical protein EUB_01601 [Eubacterium sp.]|uniref:hypothetical protein n=1 Tax=Eubacterium sp. TaxID=142586 RepID=UPI00306CD393